MLNGILKLFFVSMMLVSLTACEINITPPNDSMSGSKKDQVRNTQEKELITEQVVKKQADKSELIRIKDLIELEAFYNGLVLDEAEKKIKMGKSKYKFLSNDISSPLAEQKFDTVKISGQFVYRLAGKSILAYRAYPAADAKLVKKVDLSQAPKSMLIANDRLIVLGEKFSKNDKEYFFVKTFDIKKKEDPREIGYFELRAQELDIRVFENSIHLIISNKIQDGQEIGELLTSIDDLPKSKASGAFPAVYRVNTHYESLNVISFISVNLEDPEEKKFESHYLVPYRHIIGSKEFYFYYSKILSNDAPDDNSNALNEETMFLHKITLSGEGAQYYNYAKIAGVEDGEPFIEDNENGLIILMPHKNKNAEEVAKEYLVHLLGSDLKETGKSEPIKIDGEIYRMKVVGNKLYLEGDAKMVIDLSRPDDIRTLGELNIPYEDYLVQPVNTTEFLVIGKAAFTAKESGLHVLLYDVSNPQEPKQIGFQSIGGKGSDSEIFENSESFILSSEKKFILFPVDIKNPGNGIFANKDYIGSVVFVFGEEGVNMRGLLESTSKKDKIIKSHYKNDLLYTFTENKFSINSLKGLQVLKTFAY